MEPKVPKHADSVQLATVHIRFGLAPLEVFALFLVVLGTPVETTVWLGAYKYFLVFQFQGAAKGLHHLGMARG
jgi:hypothetical protein